MSRPSICVNAVEVVTVAVAAVELSVAQVVAIVIFRIRVTVRPSLPSPSPAVPAPHSPVGASGRASRNEKSLGRLSGSSWRHSLTHPVVDYPLLRCAAVSSVVASSPASPPQPPQRLIPLRKKATHLKY